MHRGLKRVYECYIITIDMALFSQLDTTASNKPPIQVTWLLVVFVLFFLSSTVIHADHIAIDTINTEQQHCFLCHHGVDTSPNLPQVKQLPVTSYYIYSDTIVTALFTTIPFIQPHLRAPPVFLSFYITNL